MFTDEGKKGFVHFGFGSNFSVGKKQSQLSYRFCDVKS